MRNYIKLLRSKFKKYEIDGYIIPKNDDFFTEYSKLNRLEVISNFSGSAGSVSYTHLTLPTNREV